MAKDAPLEIWYRNTEAKTYLATFFAEINDRIAQVKSLYFDANHIYFLPEILKTTPAPRLETLHLIVQLGQIWENNRITLFGGDVASPALKNFHLHQIPVALDSLRLSGLRSLGLSHVPIASAEELLIILIDSPALEDFSLEWIVFLTGVNLSETRKRLLDGQSSMMDANCRAIPLLHLRHLTLSGPPTPFTHFLLSTIRASAFQSFDLNCALHESPGSELLVAETHHLAPALKHSMTTADKIKINTSRAPGWKLRVGMLAIEFERVQVEPRHVEEILGWVFGH